MGFSCLDIFSQHFYFNVEKQNIKKSTWIGAVSTFIVIVTASSYYIYLLNLYVNNQIDPIYRSQSIITQEKTELKLNSNLFGFKYVLDGNISLDQLQSKNNKTYLVNYAFFYYSNDQNYTYINLDIIKCTDPILIDYYCLDFSKLQNNTLALSVVDNIYSYIAIVTYGCLDIDAKKTSIPNNCATQSEIDQVINGYSSGIRFKLFTSQFNTSTKSEQVKYRNSYSFTQANQISFTTFKIQKQETVVNQGILIQQQSQFSSPIQYNSFYQNFDRQYSIQNNIQSGYIFVKIEMDEIIQQIKIKFPTIPEILALGNSILTVLMFIGIFGRFSSFKKIRNDFFMLLMQNLFQENYLHILKINKLVDNKFINQEKKQILDKKNHIIQKEQLENREYQDDDDRNFVNQNYKSQRIKTKLQIDQQKTISEIKSNFAYQNLVISNQSSQQQIKLQQEKPNLKKESYNFKAIINQKFSQAIYKNLFKTNTWIGTATTLIVIIAASSYYIYLLYLYINNQIDPIYRSQSIISQERIEVNLNSNLFAFKFQYDINISLDQLQSQNNKTYLVNYAYFFQTDNQNNTYINLDIIKCTDPNLSDYYCLDFSQLQNLTLAYSIVDNIYSYIAIATYGCLDLDTIKTSIPNNCATQSEIDQVMNGYNAGMRFKLFTSQFNTQTKNEQVQYRNSYTISQGNQISFSTFRIQKQQTVVNQGFLIQQQSNFSSPIQYNLHQQNFDRQYSIQNNIQSGYSFVKIEMDEIIQQIKIKYPTIPEILALGNSILTVLMFIGIFGRFSSFENIRNDFFMLLMQNLFQENYMHILKANKLVEDNQENKQIFNKKNLNIQKEQLEDSEYKDDNQNFVNHNNLDIFSQHFYFNVDKQNIKKSTWIGTVSTFIVIIAASSYYIYLLNLYINNQIDPIYRSQSIITQERTEISLNSNLFGFRYEYDINKSLDLLQSKSNKTYLVNYAFFYYFDNQNSTFINLDIIKCTDTNLIDFYCLDFSKLQNLTLALSVVDNLYSYIAIVTYGCLDLDTIKTSIPNDCATQSEIDQVINGYNSGIRLKLFTSQFNTSTKNEQVKYRNSYSFTQGNQIAFTTLKIQKQETAVNQGILIQQQSNFSSPIEYNSFYQTLDRKYSIQNNIQSGYIFVKLEMDEIIQQIKIKFPTIPEILALGNSILTVLMFIGIFGRFSSFKNIRNDFFMLLMQNLFQENYMHILKVNKLVEDNQEKKQIFNKKNFNIKKEQLEDSEYKEDNQNFVNQKYESQRIKTKLQIDQQKNKLEIKNKFAYQNLVISNESSPQQIKEQKQSPNLKKVSYNFKAIFNEKFSQVIYKNLFKIKCLKKSEYLLNQGLDKYTKKFIEELLVKDLNIFQIYKDILFLKKSIMILLDNQQLAAIKLIGCSQNFLNFQNQSLQSIITSSQNEKKRSHFEEQLTLLMNEEFWLGLLMGFQNLDIFSQHFYFNIDKKQIKKGTLIGTISTLVVLIAAASYYLYLLDLYLNNSIDPIYRSQNVITQERVDINLDSNIVGFRYEYDYNRSIDQLQKQNNKTYIVNYAFFYYSDSQNNSQITLDIIKCTDPNLIGFYCIDFSKLQNLALTISTIDSIYSYIGIMTYGCLDLDVYKTTVPSDCATQQEIDQVINGINSGVRLKLFTSQFNIATNKMEVSYRNQFIFTTANQLLQTNLKTQKQVTTVKQGMLFLQSTNYSSPIQYNIFLQSYDRQYSITNINCSGYSFVQINLDEIVQEIKVQYQTIPEILAVGNSILTLLMLFGFLGRLYSFDSIRKDFFMLIMQNMFQDNFMNILKKQKNVIKVNENIENNNVSIKQEKLDLSEQKEEGDYFKNKHYQSRIVKTKLQIDLQQQMKQSLKERLSYQNIRSSSLISPQSTIRTNEKFKFDKSLEKFKAICNQKFSQIISQNIFKKRFRRKEEYLQSQGLNKQSQKFIEDQMIKDLNIFQLYKDILFLKKAIMILLDKQQLSALKLVGCSQNFFDIQKEGIGNTLSFQTANQNKMSYFDEQYAIYISEELQYQHIQSFFQKCQSEKYINEIDKRILSSIY
ncbi:transmembrane protein, putative (macronuclear) [Tetrahymena thermophila SB210]|uniref:Transmembrane protein, putative n=1 Tax=Tetrahymena thermophila (strain SB210) TaxID=312017 RepID=A4VE99_TETTS|nr:transmembrane protein, putative [Tetrahymena thermophila SB210]EDK31859.3 transmembrane protein, putative [Tetrahymena thermophila SB210]|eukprot:XP_001471257.3 transmembrane protein, putative [Tetrahymena thermophila SB210]